MHSLRQDGQPVPSTVLCRHNDTILQPWQSTVVSRIAARRIEVDRELETAGHCHPGGGM